MMANTIFEYHDADGQTGLTVELYADGSDTLANSGGADTLTEQTNRKGLYLATVTEALSGLYFAVIKAGATVVDNGWVDLQDDTNTYAFRKPKLVTLTATQTFSLTGNITGNLSGSVGSVTGAVGSVTGNVGGNVSGSVASVTGNVGGNVVGSVGSISGVTFPANFGSLVISVAGAADSLVQGYVNSTLTETNAGDIADSFGFFFNVEPTTTKTVNDVGAGSGGGFWSSTEQQQIRYRLGIDGTESAPVTNTDQNLTVDLNADQSGVTIGSVSGAVGSVTGAVGSVTGNVGGNVTGSVGSIAGVTFPTNFGSMQINVSGHVSRVTLVDTTTANTDMRGTDSAALATTLDTKLSSARLQVLDDWINGGRLDLLIDSAVTQATTAATEVGKVPRAAAALTAGASIRRTNDDNAQTIDETITGVAP